MRLATAPARRPSRGLTYVPGGTLGRVVISRTGLEVRSGEGLEKLCQEIGNGKGLAVGRSWQKLVEEIGGSWCALSQEG